MPNELARDCCFLQSWQISGLQHGGIKQDKTTFDTLVKTGSESIEATLRKRRILFAGFVARMEDTRLPRCVMFGELLGGAVPAGGQEKEWMGCLLDDLRAFGY